MLVCFASEKGGAGKTTIAAALAERLVAPLGARGVPLQLADGDRQGSLAALTAASDGALPTAETVYPLGFARLAQRPGLTLLDLPSGIGVELHAALAVCDWCVVPAVPSALDLRTLPHTLARIRAAQEERGGPPRALLIPNKVDLRETMSQELLARLGGLGWPVTRTWLRERAAYRHMGAAGLGALPTGQRRAAETEIAGLADEVLERLGLAASEAAA